MSPEQQALEKLWEEHLASEFTAKSAKAAVNTMVQRPSVNHVPVMTGGVGRKQLTHFYGQYFIPQMPPDTQIIPISRTIGHDRLVDEFVFKFTHTLLGPSREDHRPQLAAGWAELHARVRKAAEAGD